MSVPVSIQEFFNTRGISYTTVTHRTAFTAQEEAAVTHVPGRQWAKTVVCYADNEPVLAVLPAHFTVDLDRLRALTGAAAVRLAEEREIASLYPECEPGAMPPLGPLYGQRVYVDRTIAADPEIVFNAGTHNDAIRIKYADLSQLVSPVVGDFGRAPGRPWL